MIDIGTILNQRFRLDKELGRGGMGAVYSATDEILQRQVAIKVLKERRGEEVGKKLRLEAQIAARLLHENVVRIYDFGQVLVDEHHVAAIDRLAQRTVDLERQTAREHARIRQQAIDAMTERRARHQRDTQRLAFVARAFGQRDGHRFRVACTREATCADAHAVFDQKRCLRCRSDLAAQCGMTNPIFIHD